MKNVFEPCSIGNLTLKNRIIRAATHEGMAHRDGMPMDDLLQTYQRLAVGGAGAIITGYVSVKQNGRTFPNMLMFDNDTYIPVYKSINERLKQFNAPIILQIAHGGSRSMAKITGQDVISASGRRKNDYGDAVKEASETEIRSIVGAFVDAIVRAKAAGFDGVELHAAHGYLLSEFVSPVLNKRRDEWGGSTENRLRIVTGIFSSARKEVGNSFPILVKMSSHDEFRRGLTEAEAVKIARILQAASCDAIEVSCGYGDFMHTIHMPKVPVDAVLGLMPRYRNMPGYQKMLFRLMAPFLARVRAPLHNYNVPLAEQIKRHVDIPVIAVGGIRNLQDMKTIVSDKGIDFVSLSRPFIIEPDIVNRFQQGQQSSRCIDCGFCLIGVTKNKLRCYYGRVPDSRVSRQVGQSETKPDNLNSK
ncbi:MAG: NADH:flavin oxidoreductase [Syntrophus sp. (in: bacteria)]|nr:NADH:flavin oxidoreductase [Syntrophus sp. (in: bacteria)]